MTQHDILGFDITVVDAVLVKVGNRFEDLTDDKSGGFLREISNSLEFIIQLSVTAKL